MVKKVLATGAAAAIFLSAAVPAFAYYRRHRSNDELTVSNRDTRVVQHVDVDADTGDNYASGGSSHHGRHHRGGDSDVNTGSATVRDVVVVADVNTTDVASCGCFDDVTVRNSHTRVYQNVDVRADSGDNRARGGDVDTGNALVDSVVVDAFVNGTFVGN